MTKNPLALPFVSVIVPTYNLAASTDDCLKYLHKQSYPKNKYEIIVVDNGSSDNTQEVIKKYPVKMLVQQELKSPYPSRNMGIREAKGEIIALVDAKCIPDIYWLENGIKTLKSKNADLVGGAVIFTFSSKKKTGGEMFDSLTNIRMEENIKNRQVAKTGNLIAYKYVYDKIGLFPFVRSGGDVIWTGRATKNGFKLVYGEDAKVYYKARKLAPLLKKQYRVGKGQPQIWLNEGKGMGFILKKIMKTTVGLLIFRTPGIAYLKKRIQETGNDEEMKNNIFKIFMAGWLCIWATNIGRCSYLLTNLFKRQNTIKHSQ